MEFVWIWSMLWMLCTLVWVLYMTDRIRQNTVAHKNKCGTVVAFDWPGFIRCSYNYHDTLSINRLTREVSWRCVELSWMGFALEWRVKQWMIGCNPFVEEKMNLLRSLDCTLDTQLRTAANSLCKLAWSHSSHLFVTIGVHNYCKSHWNSPQIIMQNWWINLTSLAGATAKFRAIPGRESTNWHSDQAQQRWRINADDQRFHFDVEVTGCT